MLHMAWPSPAGPLFAASRWLDVVHSGSLAFAIHHAEVLGRSALPAAAASWKASSAVGYFLASYISTARSRTVLRSAGGGVGLGCWLCANAERLTTNRTMQCPVRLIFTEETHRRSGGFLEKR